MIWLNKRCRRFIWMRILFMSQLPSSIFVLFLIFTKVSMRLKHNNLLNFSLLRYLNHGVKKFILMILKLLRMHGHRGLRGIVYLIWLMIILKTWISHYWNRFIGDLRLVRVNQLKRLISIMRSLLISRLSMLISCWRRKCMMRLWKYWPLSNPCLRHNWSVTRWCLKPSSGVF